MSKEDAGIIGKLQAIALVILSFGLCILSIGYGLSFIFVEIKNKMKPSMIGQLAKESIRKLERDFAILT